MKTTKNFLVISVILLTIVSCVTQTQVKEIVATSNAAMIDVPDLPQADGRSVDEAKLKTAIERIETVIAAHPEQTVLVNSLRLRQAMLLTVAKKDKAAKIVWSKVTQPSTQRDAALYSLQTELVWWFRVAKNFKDKDIELGKKYLETIKKECDALPKRSDIRDYLETMHAAIGLQIANRTNVQLGDAGARREKKKEVAGDMVARIKRYAEQYDLADQEWIASNWKEIGIFPDVPISVLRARVQIRRVMKKYFDRTDKLELEEFEAVKWEPEWVEKLWQALKQGN